MTMENFKSINEVLAFAIQAEEEAVDFYTQLAQGARNDAMRDTFTQLAKEEEGHAKKIKNLKMDAIHFAESTPITDLQISDYINPEVNYKELDYSEVLVIAINREKRAYMLYSKLAEMIEESEMKKLFYFLAKEESRHKNRFEVEYDEHVLSEN